MSWIMTATTVWASAPPLLHAALPAAVPVASLPLPSLATVSSQIHTSVPVDVLASGLEGPAGIAFGPAGRVFATDWEDGKVLELLPDGSRQTIASAMVRPRALTWEGGSRLLVAADGLRAPHPDAGRRGVLARLDLATGALSVLADGLRRPRGIARKADGTVYVTAGALRLQGDPDDDDGEDRDDDDCDRDNDDVATFSGVIAKLAPDATAFTVVASGFKRPAGILVEADGSLLVASERYHRAGSRLVGGLFRVTPAGAVTLSVADPLRRPWGIARSTSGDLYVSGRRVGGTDKGVILKVTAGGQVSEFASGLGRPRGLALDPGGDLLAADGRQGRVLRFRVATLACATFFGPERLVRQSGPPTVYSRTLSPQAWLGAPYTLKVVNGEADGRNRISSATITVGTTQVAGPSDFSQQVAGFERPITLSASQTPLVVRLSSTPGAYLTLSACGRSADATPPQLGIAVPAPGSTTGDPTPRILVRYSDVVGAGEPAASGVDVSTLRVLVDEEDVSALFTRRADEAEAELASALASGLHRIRVEIQDRAGNPADVEATVTVDLAPPTLSVQTPAPGSYLRTASTPVQIHYADDLGIDLASLRVKVNGVDRTAAFTRGPQDATATISGLPAGSNLIEAQIADLAGHTVSASAPFNVDATPPTLTIARPLAGAHLGSSDVEAVVQYADDQELDLASFQARLDGQPVSLAAGPQGASGHLSAADGSHSLWAAIMDRAGNPVEATVTFQVDTRIPQISIAEPAPGSIVGSSGPHVVVRYSDDSGLDLTSLKVLVENVDRTTPFSVTPTEATATLPAGSLADGSRTIRAEIKDLTGSPNHAESQFTVDTQGPGGSVDEPQGWVSTASPSVRITLTDAGSGVDPASIRVWIDGSDRTSLFAITAAQASGVLAGLADGVHPLHVELTDRAGNAGTIEGAVRVDTAPPQVAIEAPPPYSNDSTPEVRISYADPDGSGVALPTLHVYLRAADGSEQEVTSALNVGAGLATGSLPGLADAGWTLRATLSDAAGNPATASRSFVLDAQPPTATLVAPAAGAYEDTATPSFLVRYQDVGSGLDLGTAELEVDGQSVTGVLTLGPTEGSGMLQVPLADGVHHASFAVRDRAGNSASPASIDFTTDTAPPQVSLLPVDGSITSAALVALRVDLSDAIGIDPEGVTVRLDGVARTDFVVAADHLEAELPLPDGAHLLEAEARDRAGNRATAQAHFTVDRGPGISLTLDLADGTWTNAGSLTVTGVVSGGSGSATVTAGGQLATVGADGHFSVEVPLGADPDATITVTAVDTLNHAITQTRTVHVDRDAPVLTGVTPAAGSTLPSPQVTVEGTVQDRASATVTVNGSNAAVSGDHFTAQVTLPEGPSTLQVVATDAAGNAAPLGVPLVVDSAPPQVSVVAPAAATNQVAVQVRITYSDGAGLLPGSLRVSLQAADGSSSDVTGLLDAGLVEANGSIGALAEGPWVLRAEIRDKAGNLGQASSSFLVDRVAPQYQILAPARLAFVNTATPALRVTYSDDRSGVDLGAVAASVDEQPVPLAIEAAEATGTLPTLAEGPHALSVTLYDKAGNAAASVAHAFNVDLTAPTVTVQAPGSDFVRSPLLRATYADALSGIDPASVHVYLDDVDQTPSFLVAPGEAQATLASLADGPHTVRVEVKDKAGNPGSASRSFTLDRVAPLGAVAQPAEGAFLGDPAVLVKVTYSDELSGIDPPSLQVLVDGVDRAGSLAAGPGQAEGVLAGFADGDHPVLLKVKDRAGNPVEVASHFSVDTIPPALTGLPEEGSYVGAIQGGVYHLEGSVADLDPGVTITCHSGSTTVTATVSGGHFSCDVPLTEGNNSIEVVATDGTGHSTTQTRTINHDSTPPILHVEVPQPGSWTNQTQITVSGTATDASPVFVDVDGRAAVVESGGVFHVDGVPVGSGEVTMTVTAKDSALNVTTVPVTVKVDRDAPVVTITQPLAGSFVGGTTITVTGTVTDASPVTLIDVNGQPGIATGGAGHYAFSVTVPAIDQTLVVTAHDAAGNPGSAQVQVHLDTAPPLVTIEMPQDGLVTKDASVVVSGTVSDASTVTLTVDGAATSVVDGRFSRSVTLGAEGPRAVTVVATDQAQNQASPSVHVTVDRTAPTLDVVSPAEGAVLGSLPLTVLGTATDLNGVTVTVDGEPATRVGEAWSFTASSQPEGNHTFQIVATDLAANTVTRTRSVIVDLGPPTLVVTSPQNGLLTREASVQVTGTVQDRSAVTVKVNNQAATVSGTDCSSGCAFSGTVELAEDSQILQVVATDATGRSSAPVQVQVTRDSTRPTLVLSAPDRISQGRPGQVTATATDLSLAQVTIQVAGQALATCTTSGPCVATLTVPDGTAAGTTLLVTALAVDAAGNEASASKVVAVTADGVLSGQVLDDETGLPLAGATVTLVAGGTASTSTDERGRYSLPVSQQTAVLRMEKAGFTSVIREVSVAPGVGTIPVDARLTRVVKAAKVNGGTPTLDVSLSPLWVVLVASAGAAPASGLLRSATSAASVHLLLTPPAGSYQVTPLSPQGLPGLLPLGWSPFVSFDLRSDGASGAALQAALDGLPAGPWHLVRWREGTHAWHLVTGSLEPQSGSLALTLPELGTYALAMADAGEPVVVVPQVGEPLQGVDPVQVPADAALWKAVVPAEVLPTGGTAAGSVALASGTPLPSGTVLQAQATETFRLSSGEEGSEDTWRFDVIAYRAPESADVTIPADAPANRLHAQFPMTPQRRFQLEEYGEGKLEMSIWSGRENARGVVGGNDAVTLDQGEYRISVAAHALGENTLVDLIVPGAPSNILPADPTRTVLGEVALDLGGNTLAIPAELSVAAQAPTGGSLFVARVIRIGGIPRLTVASLAEVQAGRIVTVAGAGLPGVVVGGRYVFYRSAVALGFVGGTTSSSAGPVRALVSTDSTPFVAMSDAAAGQYVVVALPGTVAVSAKVPGTSLAGSGSVTVAEGETTPLNLTLAGVVSVATVSPGNGEQAVLKSAQVEIVSPQALANALDTTSDDKPTIALLKCTTEDCSGSSPVAVRRVLSVSRKTLALVPVAQLEPAQKYRFEASGLVDVFDAPVQVPVTTWTTKADVAPEIDIEKIVFSFPDTNGLVNVTAPEGTLPLGTTFLCINAANGYVTTADSHNGGLGNLIAITFPATISDRLLVTLTFPDGTTKSWERSKYVAADGTTGIGTAGGTVDDPTGQYQLRIPDGALDEGVRLKISGFKLADLPVGERQIPDFGTNPAGSPSAHFGTGLRIESQDKPTFKKEVKLSFPLPDFSDPNVPVAERPPTPQDAFYYVVKKIKGPDGQVLWESVDHAFVETAADGTARVVTASYPFGGYTNSFGLFDPTGQAQVAEANLAYLMWTFDSQLPGKPLAGVVTGTVRRSKFGSGGAAYDPVPAGSYVKGAGLASGNSELALVQADGTYTLWDPRYTGGQVTVEATLAQTGEKLQATAYEANPQDFNSTQLRHYRNAAVANLLFPAEEPPPPQPVLDVVVARVEKVPGEPGQPDKTIRHIVNGIVTVGMPLHIGLKPNDPSTLLSEISVEIDGSGAGYAVVQDTLVPNFGFVLSGDFSFAAAGPHNIKARLARPFAPPFVRTETILVVPPGGASNNPVSGRPLVITGRTVPKDGAKQVEASVLPELAFTEPLTNLRSAATAGPANVVLEEVVNGVGTAVPIDLVGVDRQGSVVTLVGPSHEITSLTVKPRQLLKFGAKYRLVLNPQGSSAPITELVHDLDKADNGDPDPKALWAASPNEAPYAAYAVTFDTAGTEALPPQPGQMTFGSPGIVVLGQRAYVVDTAPSGGRQGTVVVFDVEDPATPVKVDQDPAGYVVPRPVDLAGVKESAVTGNRLLAVASASAGAPAPSSVYLFDMSEDGKTKWIGASSLTSSALEGFIFRIALKGRHLYAATQRKGLQIVDMGLALQEFEPYLESASGQVNVRTKLSTDGQGFGQSAVVRTVSLGSNQQLRDVDVDDFVLGDGSQDDVAAVVGMEVTAPPNVLWLARGGTGDLLWQGGIAYASAQLLQGQVVSFGRVGLEGRRLLAVAGSGTVQGVGKGELVALLDVDDPAQPVILSILELPAIVGAGGNAVPSQIQDLLFRDDLLIVGRSGGEAALVSVATPEQPRVVGKVAGLLGRLGLSEDGVLVSTAFSPFGNPGTLRTAYLDPSGVLLRLKAKQATARVVLGQNEKDVLASAPGQLPFTLSRAAFVTVETGGSPVGVGKAWVVKPGPEPGPKVDLAQQPQPTLSAGLHVLEMDQSMLDGLTAEATVLVKALDAADSGVQEIKSARLLASPANRPVIEMGHTVVKGVDLLTGHLVVQRTDLSVKGRNLGLELMRTYSSAALAEDHALGAGWEWTYGGFVEQPDKKQQADPDRFVVHLDDGRGVVYELTADGTLKAEEGYFQELLREPVAGQPGKFRFELTDLAGNKHVYEQPSNWTKSARIWPLVRIQEPHGDQVAVSLDGQGRVSSVRQIEGGFATSRAIALKWEKKAGVDRVVQASVSSLALQVDYTYDNEGNLVKVRRAGMNLPGKPQADAVEESYAYTTDLADTHQLRRFDGPAGFVKLEFEYKAASEFPWDKGVVSKVRELKPGGADEWGFGYQFAQHEATVVDARHNPTTYTMDERGMVSQVEEPQRSTGVAWDPTTRRVTDVNEAQGKKTTLGHDSRGHVDQITEGSQSAPERVTKVTTDPKFGKVVSILRDHEPGVKKLKQMPLTEQGDVDYVLDEEGNKTDFSYDLAGRLTGVKSPRGHDTTFSDFDPFGQARLVQRPENVSVNRVYDARGRLESETDSMGRATDYTWDGQDRLKRTVQKPGKGQPDVVTDLEYWPGGELKTRRVGGKLVESWSLGPQGRPSSVTRQTLENGVVKDTLTTSFEWDENGNLHAEKDPRGVRREYTYDDLNRRIKTTITDGVAGEAVGQVVEEAHYSEHRKEWEKDELGAQTSYEYDVLDRVTAKVLPIVKPDGSKYREEMAYDFSSNPTQVKDANSNPTSMKWDGLGRLLTSQDAAGRMRQLIYNDDEGSHVNLAFDKELTTGLQTQFTYDKLDRELTRAVQQTPAGASQAEKYLTQTTYLDGEHSITVKEPGRTVKRTFDGLDRMVEEVVDPEGLKLTTKYSYDAAGHLASVTDPKENTTYYRHDGLGRLLEVQDPLGKTRKVDYADVALVKGETDRRGARIERTYDNLGRPRRSTLTAHGVDSWAVSQVPWSSEIVYDDAARTMTQIDARGVPTRHVLDGLHRVVETRVDPSGLNLRRAFGWDGVNLRTTTDELLRTTQFDYDPVNRQTTVTPPAPFTGETRTTQYLDGANQVVETAVKGDGPSRVTTTQLDALGRVRSVTQNEVLRKKVLYDAAGRVQREEDGEGRAVEFGYDGAGRVTTKTEAPGTDDVGVWKYQYDKNGNLEKEADPRSTLDQPSTRFQHDALDRLDYVWDGLNNQTHFGHDAEGNRTLVQDANLTLTRYYYDARGALTKVEQAAPKAGESAPTTVYEYDENRNERFLHDARQKTTEYRYDAANRQTHLIEPGAPAMTYDYWPTGTLKLIRDQDGRTEFRDYDQKNRLSQQIWAALPSETAGLWRHLKEARYSYDGHDNLTEVKEYVASGSDPPGSPFVQSYVFDPLGRQKEAHVFLPDGQQQHIFAEYYKNDLRNWVTAAGPAGASTTTWTYDQRNRLKTVAAGAQTLATYFYYPDSLPKSATYGNGVAAAWNYDAADRVLDVQATAGASLLQRYQYPAQTAQPPGYDAVGNRLRQVEVTPQGSFTTTYGYDALYRLTNVSYPEQAGAPGKAVAYGYDAVGNRTSETPGLPGLENQPPLTVRTYTPDDRNRLSSVTDSTLPWNNQHFEWDQAGRMVRRKIGAEPDPQVGLYPTELAYRYDARGMLVEVEQATLQPSGQPGAPPTVQVASLGRYQYDASGRRTKKIGADGLIQFLHDGSDILAEFDGSGTPKARYEWGQGLVNVSRASGGLFFGTDPLGTPSLLTDGQGAVKSRPTHDVWGLPRSSAFLAETQNRVGLTGHYFDAESNLVYARARFFDPGLGRFMTADSYLGDVNNPPSLHRYVYAEDRPTYYTDPTGHFVNAGAGAVAGWVWGTTQILTNAVGAELGLNKLNTAGENAALLAQNTAAGAGIGLSVDAALLAGPLALAPGPVGDAIRAGIGGIGGAGFGALTFRGVGAKSFGELGHDVALGAGTGAVLGAFPRAGLTGLTGLGLYGGAQTWRQGDRIGGATEIGVTVAGAALGALGIRAQQRAAQELDSGISSVIDDAVADAFSSFARESRPAPPPTLNANAVELGPLLDGPIPAPSRGEILRAKYGAISATELDARINGRTVEARLERVARRAFQYEVDQLASQGGIGRARLGKLAEVRATRTLRRYAEHAGIDLGPEGLSFQATGGNSFPDVLYKPGKLILDFKLTPKAVKERQFRAFRSDFPGYLIRYLYGDGQ
jgi:RHS repeat-associated protein